MDFCPKSVYTLLYLLYKYLPHITSVFSAHYVAFSSDPRTVHIGGYMFLLTSLTHAAAAHPCSFEGGQSCPAQPRGWVLSQQLVPVRSWLCISQPGHPLSTNPVSRCLLGDLLCGASCSRCMWSCLEDRQTCSSHEWLLNSLVLPSSSMSTSYQEEDMTC